VKIALAWPAQPLWPNTRLHWGARNKRRQAQKHEAYFAAFAAGAGSYRQIGGVTRRELPERIPVTLTFHKNDRRRFDLDNALAACKGALDGLSAALGVDDSRFDVRPVLGAPVAGGCVIVEVDQALAAVGVVLG
jgi:crossover junction endodeoxyribonuclease RusA